MNLEEKLTAFENLSHILPLPEDIVSDFIGFFQNEDKSFLEILNRKTKGKFKDGFSYRTLNFWEQEGLLSNNRTEKNVWRNYSLLDQVWLNIIIELRGFGLDLTSIKSLKVYLSKFEEDIDTSYPLLSFYLALSVSENDDELYLIFAENKCQLILKRHLISHLLNKPLPHLLLINISKIFELVSKLQRENNKIDDNKYEVISGVDLKIHRTVKDKINLKTTVFKDKLGNASRLEIEREIDVDKKVVEGLRNFEYGEQIIYKHDNKIVGQRQIIKEKI